MREFLENLTKKAGDFLLNHFQKEHELIKVRASVKEIATGYDKKADELIILEIKRNYPNHSVLTEESGLQKANSDYLWVVDSLDGTSNFANSNPFFSVCIAVIYKGNPILGSIYAPAINEFYIGERGKGTYLNQKRIEISETSDLSKSYLLYCEVVKRTE
ncbi:MAG: inositol monophosphatase [Candidatus Aenigmarchaeota archaeon]|nr:inositol monophosphatase [Candidatus Aenigmarchaeota archaeon]